VAGSLPLVAAMAVPAATQPVPEPALYRTAEPPSAHRSRLMAQGAPHRRGGSLPGLQPLSLLARASQTDFAEAGRPPMLSQQSQVSPQGIGAHLVVAHAAAVAAEAIG